MLSTNSFQEIKKDNNNLFIGFEEKKFAGFLGRISHFSGIIYTSYILERQQKIYFRRNIYFFNFEHLNSMSVITRFFFFYTIGKWSCFLADRKKST